MSMIHSSGPLWFSQVHVGFYRQRSCTLIFRYSFLILSVILSLLIHLLEIFVAIVVVIKQDWVRALITFAWATISASWYPSSTLPPSQSTLLDASSNSLVETSTLSPALIRAVPWVVFASTLLSLALVAWAVIRARYIVTSDGIKAAFLHRAASNWWALRSYSHFCILSRIRWGKTLSEKLVVATLLGVRGAIDVLAALPRMFVFGVVVYAIVQIPDHGTSMAGYGAGGVELASNSDYMLLTACVLAMALALIALAIRLVRVVVCGLLYAVLSCIHGNLRTAASKILDISIFEVIVAPQLMGHDASSANNYLNRSTSGTRDRTKKNSGLLSAQVVVVPSSFSAMSATNNDGEYDSTFPSMSLVPVPATNSAKQAMAAAQSPTQSHFTDKSSTPILLTRQSTLQEADQQLQQPQYSDHQLNRSEISPPARRFVLNGSASGNSLTTMSFYDDLLSMNTVSIVEALDIRKGSITYESVANSSSNHRLYRQGYSDENEKFTSNDRRQNHLEPQQNSENGSNHSHFANGDSKSNSNNHNDTTLPTQASTNVYPYTARTSTQQQQQGVTLVDQYIHPLDMVTTTNNSHDASTTSGSHGYYNGSRICGPTEVKRGNTTASSHSQDIIEHWRIHVDPSSPIQKRDQIASSQEEDGVEDSNDDYSSMISLSINSLTQIPPNYSGYDESQEFASVYPSQRHNGTRSNSQSESDMGTSAGGHHSQSQGQGQGFGLGLTFGGYDMNDLNNFVPQEYMPRPAYAFGAGAGARGRGRSESIQSAALQSSETSIYGGLGVYISSNNNNHLAGNISNNNNNNNYSVASSPSLADSLSNPMYQQQQLHFNRQRKGSYASSMLSSFIDSAGYYSHANNGYQPQHQPSRYLDPAASRYRPRSPSHPNILSRPTSDVPTDSVGTSSRQSGRIGDLNPAFSSPSRAPAVVTRDRHQAYTPQEQQQRQAHRRSQSYGAPHCPSYATPQSVAQNQRILIPSPIVYRQTTTTSTMALDTNRDYVYQQQHAQERRDHETDLSLMEALAIRDRQSMVGTASTAEPGLSSQPLQVMNPDLVHPLDMTPVENLQLELASSFPTLVSPQGLVGLGLMLNPTSVSPEHNDENEYSTPTASTPTTDNSNSNRNHNMCWTPSFGMKPPTMPPTKHLQPKRPSYSQDLMPPLHPFDDPNEQPQQPYQQPYNHYPQPPITYEPPISPPPPPPRRAPQALYHSNDLTKNLMTRNNSSDTMLARDRSSPAVHYGLTRTNTNMTQHTAYSQASGTSVSGTTTATLVYNYSNASQVTRKTSYSNRDVSLEDNMIVPMMDYGYNNDSNNDYEDDHIDDGEDEDEETGLRGRQMSLRSKNRKQLMVVIPRSEEHVHVQQQYHYPQPHQHQQQQQQQHRPQYQHQLYQYS